MLCGLWLQVCVCTRGYAFVCMCVCVCLGMYVFVCFSAHCLSAYLYDGGTTADSRLSYRKEFSLHYFAVLFV